MHALMPDLFPTLSAEKRSRFEVLWQEERKVHQRGETFEPKEFQDRQTFVEYRHWRNRAHPE